jgi:voltage-gated potassium channel
MHHWHDAIYFSVVTFTTLGYGDFSPVTQTAKTIVILQVASAVIFITVFLGAFVSNIGQLIKIQERKT